MELTEKQKYLLRRLFHNDNISIRKIYGVIGCIALFTLMLIINQLDGIDFKSIFIITLINLVFVFILKCQIKEYIFANLTENNYGITMAEKQEIYRGTNFMGLTIVYSLTYNVGRKKYKSKLQLTHLKKKNDPKLAKELINRGYVLENEMKDLDEIQIFAGNPSYFSDLLTKDTTPLETMNQIPIIYSKIWPKFFVVVEQNYLENIQIDFNEVNFHKK